MKYSVIISVFFISIIFSSHPSNFVYHEQDPSNSRELLFPSQSVININNMAYWMKKSSAGTTSGSPNGTQVDYPIGTGGLIYEDGMLWGVKVSDGNSLSPRVGGTTYFAGLKAGRVVYDGSGNVIGSTDPSSHHVWRVRRDFMTADLIADADNFGASVEDVYEQYEYDWNNWPAAWGAPYHDVDSDGSYDPTVDIPGYPGADQTLWVVANDVPQIVDDNGNIIDEQNTAPNVYGADPVGVELQVTLWAYNFSAENPLGNVIFKKAKMKYTGLPEGYNNFDSAIAHLDTVYFTQWSDPDLGTYTDDYVGCDVDLSLGYVYNGNVLDGVFDGIYNMSVPAGGYDFFQGPEVDGEYLPMTAFTYFGAGSSISDPDLSNFSGSLQFFNLMEGFLPRPEYPDQVPWTDPITGEVTNFTLSGNPLTGEGWVDGIQLPPGDRRMVMASGPFAMELGESQEIVLGLIGGQGVDNLTSLSVLKYHDSFAQYSYDNNFNLPSPPQSPEVNITSLTNEIILNWDSNHEAVENPVPLGFEFEGYNIYQLPYPSASKDESIRLETFDKMNFISVIFDNIIDPESGYIVQVPVQFGANTGIQRYLSLDWDHISDNPLLFGVTYHLAVTAYSYLPDNDESPFNTLESQLIPISVTFGPPQMDYGADAGETVPTDHEGLAGGGVEVEVISPDQLTGDDYQVYFDQQHYYRDINGIWQETDSSPGQRDCSESTVTGTAITSETVGTIDLVLTYDQVCPGGAWVDGLQFDLPDDIVVNSWPPVSGCSYPDYDQNCVNQDGTLGVGNVLTYGDSARSEFGMIEGGQVIVVNVQPFDFPQDISYEVWDDGYDGTIVDASGTTTVTELGYEFKTIKHWNMANLSTGEVPYEDQTIIGGMQLEDIIDGVYNPGGYEVITTETPIVDGFQLHVDVLYTAPINYGSISDNGVWYGTQSYTIGSYFDYGWATTARAIDSYGAGTTELNILQRDVKVVWDGEYGDPLENGFIPVVSGGSQVWIYGARNGDLANHPSPENPGTGDPFLITVPFKVYDMEVGDEPVQISLIIYDRIQAAGTGYDGSYDGNGDGTPEYHAFNPYNRMYTEFLNRPYEETLVDFWSNEAHLTWNTVWWGAPYSAGDEILFVYSNPIQQGIDTYSFSTVAPVEFAIEKGDVNYDEDVNISDVVMLINYLLQITDLETNAQLFASDFNSDYAINISDAVGIINSILGQSARLMATLSDAGNVTISIQEEPVTSNNVLRLPVEITSDGALAALQIELNYESEILEPMYPITEGEGWNGINVLFHSPNPGKVVYLFYSLNGAEIPIDTPPLFEFRNISGQDKYSTKVRLNEAVFANPSGVSALVEYGNTLSKTNVLPEKYAMHPNYPNPFNPITYINYDLPKMSVVNIEIFNILGQKVKTLMSGNQMAGHHRVQWNGKNDFDKALPSGVYLVKFKANHFDHHQKIMLLK